MKLPVISATKVHNYLKKDPILDWVNLYGEKKQSDKSLQHILNRGILFENEVVNYLRKQFNVKTVSDKYSNFYAKKTISYMKQGIPIIHSAPLYHPHLRLRGIADLLIRKDILHQIINNVEETKDTSYVVIDIKYTTINLRSDKIHILNSPNILAYKGQVYIYNEILNYIQKSKGTRAYLLGHRYKVNDQIFNSCFSHLGTVDFSGVDKAIPSQTSFAIDWYRDLILHGKSWDIHNPHRIELFPNMTNHDNNLSQLAEQIREITMIWQCGYLQRKLAFEHKVTSWRDPKCTAELLGFKGKRAELINNILNINRDETIKTGEIVTKSNLDWLVDDDVAYVDFETTNNILQSGLNIPVISTVFMIGIYYKDQSDWKYTCFCCKELTYEEEARIALDFVQFVNKINNPKLVMWYAEETLWNKLITKHNLPQVNWFNLYDKFIKEPILIKGCFSFGLKAIVKALYGTAKEGNCTNGLDALIHTYISYQKGEGVTEDVIKYNEMDCKNLYLIVTNLKEISKF